MDKLVRRVTAVQSGGGHHEAKVVYEDEDADDEDEGGGPSFKRPERSGSHDRHDGEHERCTGTQHNPGENRPGIHDEGHLDSLAVSQSIGDEFTSRKAQHRSQHTAHDTDEQSLAAEQEIERPLPKAHRLEHCDFEPAPGEGFEVRVRGCHRLWPTHRSFTWMPRPALTEHELVGFAEVLVRERLRQLRHGR